METLTDQELLDAILAVGPQTVLDVYAAADEFRLPGEAVQPSYLARMFSRRAAEIDRQHIRWANAYAYERLAQQLAFSRDAHRLVRQLRATAAALVPRGSDSAESTAARLELMRKLRTAPLSKAVLALLGPRNRG